MQEEVLSRCAAYRPDRSYLSMEDALWAEVERTQLAELRSSPMLLPSEETIADLRAYWSQPPAFGGQGPTRVDRRVETLQILIDTTTVATRCENPISYSAIRSRAATVDEAIRAAGLSTKQPFLFATLSKPIINAEVKGPDPTGRRVALFNERLLYYFWGLGRLLAATVDIRIDPGGVTWGVTTGDELAEALIRQRGLGPLFARELLMVGEYVPRSLLPPPSDQPFSEEQLRFTQRLSIPMELWVVAHEYAHVLRGHRGTLEAREAWLNELEADSVATELVYGLLPRTDAPELLLLSPMMALRALELVREACHVQHAGIPPGPATPEDFQLVEEVLGTDSGGGGDHLITTVGTHPPLWVRLAIARERWATEVRQQGGSPGGNPALMRNTTALFAAALPELQRVRRRLESEPRCQL